ncbi:MAG: tetratricopeptide repeat protein [Pseudomonadota bacterium]
MELAPRAANYSNLGLMYYYLGRYDEAAAAARSGIELAPDNSALWMNLGDILSAAHAAEESREAFRKADELASASLRINASDAWTKLDLAWINAMLDNRDSAFEFIADAADGLPEDPYVDYINGLILNRYNDTDGALTAFEEAVDKGYPPFMIAAEPHLRNLYDHPRFTALARDGG